MTAGAPAYGVSQQRRAHALGVKRRALGSTGPHADGGAGLRQWRLWQWMRQWTRGQ